MPGGSADPNRSTVPIRERADLVYLLLDGLRRPHARKSKEAILCALAIARDGSLVPLSMRSVARETERAWLAFLRDLRARGVGRELRLVCGDDHPALLSAVQAVFPDVPLQISVAHRLLTLARKVDPQFRATCLAEARQIFTAPDLDAAVARFREWRARWLKHGHRAVNSLEADLASCLTFYRFPSSLWPKIRTVNLVEREFRQARRDAPPAPADETDQEPAASQADAWEAPAATPARRSPAFQPWTVSATSTMTLDRIFQGDPMTESLLTLQVPVEETMPATTVTPTRVEEPIAEHAAGSSNGHAPAGFDEGPQALAGDPSTPDSPSGPEGIAAGHDYPLESAHAHDLSQDAEFMWWLQQQRQQQGRALPVRALVIATVLAGLITGVLLAHGL
jgi:hypothetical protein